MNAEQQELFQGSMRLRYFVMPAEYDTWPPNPAKISAHDLENLQIMTRTCMADVNPMNVRERFLSLFVECQPQQEAVVQANAQVFLPAFQLKMMLTRWTQVRQFWNHRQLVTRHENVPFDVIQDLQVEVGEPIVCFNGGNTCAIMRDALRRMLVTQDGNTQTSRDFENAVVTSLQVVIYDPDPDANQVDYEDEDIPFV